MSNRLTVPTDATPSFPGGKQLLRPRLLELLGGQGRVTVVKAEGGAGKTSLVAAWVESAGDDVPTLWVTLDENCRSARSFWHRMLLSMLDRGLITADSTLGRYALGEADTSHAPSLVADELRSRRGRFRLVIDNLHFLDETAQDELAWMARHAPALEIVATTRHDTVLDTGSDAGLFGTTVISSDELALTVDELTQLSARLGAPLGEEEIERIHRITQGHVLSSRLSLSALLAQDLPAWSAADARADFIEHVAGLVSQELLPAFASEAATDAAGMIALPSHVDSALAATLLDDDRAWQWLESLVEQGAGTIRVVAGRPVFSFHPLVRSALSARALRRLPASEVEGACRVAASQLVSWGDPVEVIRLLIAAGDYDSVLPFYVREFSELATHRVDDLVRVIEVVPDQMLRAHGTLAITLAVQLSEREARPSPRVLELARWGLDDLARQPEPAGALPRFLRATVRMAAHRASRRYREAADAGAELAKLADALDAHDRARIGGGVFAAALQVVITDLLDGRLDAAVEHSTGMVGDPHRPRAAHLTSILAYGRALDGEMPEARNALGRLPTALPPTWPTTVNAVGWNFARALLFLEDGDTEGAASALEPLAHRSAHFEHWAMLLWTRGLIRLVDDDALTGYDELTRGLRRARGRVASAFMIDHLFGLHADLAMHAGETLHSTRILALAPEGPSVSLSRARQDLLVHEPSRALDLALRARASSRTERQLVGASLTAAIAADRLGLAKESGQHARRAVDGLRRNGLTSPLAFLPRHEAEPLLASHGFEWPAHIDKVFFAGGAALTPRELLVLRHLGSGASLSAIAQQLFVSPNTVKTQVKSVYRKLGVSQRAAAVAAAQERGLL